MVPKIMATRMRCAPGCDLHLHHKMLLLNECLRADNSKTMSLSGQNSEIAFFFHLIYIGLSTCGSPGYPEAALSTPVRCRDGCHWEATPCIGISILMQDLQNSKTPVGEPAWSPRD